MADNLYAPPTADEIAEHSAGAAGASGDLYAPPTADELATHAPQPPQSKDWVDYLKEAPDDLSGFLEKTNRPATKLLGYALSKPVRDKASALFDYPGGITREALAKLAGTLTPGENPIKMSDVISSAMPGTGDKPTPGVGDIAKQKFGLPEKSWPIPGTNGKTISTTDAINLIGNALTNPLSWGGAAAAGESTYASGLKKIDQAITEKDKTPFSEVMKENGAPAGTTKQIAAANEKLIAQKTAARNAMYDEVTNSPTGGGVDVSTMPKTQSFIDNLRENPLTEDKADDFQNILKKITNVKNPEYDPVTNPKVPSSIPRAPVDVSKISKWKSAAANSLPDSHYFTDATGKRKALPVSQQFLDNVASDYRGKIVDTGEAVRPGLGEDIDNVNDELGTMLSARKPLAAQVSRGTTTNAVTSVDAPLAYFAPLAFAAKKAADISKLTAARTLVGKGLMGIPAPAATVSAAQNSPWFNMKNNNSNNSQ